MRSPPTQIRSRPVGYAGVSTADQNLALPEVADRSRMRKKIFSQHVSGAAIDRPALFEARWKSVHEGDTLVVWEARCDRLAPFWPRQLIDTVDAPCAREKAPRSEVRGTRRARHDDLRGDAWSSTYSAAVEAMLADPEPSGRHNPAPRALHAEVHDPLGPAARWRPLQLCWDACHRRPRPVCYAALVCLTRLLWGVKAIKFAGRAAGERGVQRVGRKPKLRGAVTRTEFGSHQEFGSPSSVSGRGSNPPRPEGFVSEDAKRAAGSEMALDVERVVRREWTRSKLS